MAFVYWQGKLFTVGYIGSFYKQGCVFMYYTVRLIDSVYWQECKSIN